jgi:hypothetical protein
MTYDCIDELAEAVENNGPDDNAAPAQETLSALTDIDRRLRLLERDTAQHRLFMAATTIYARLCAQPGRTHTYEYCASEALAAAKALLGVLVKDSPHAD